MHFGIDIIPVYIIYDFGYLRGIVGYVERHWVLRMAKCMKRGYPSPPPFSHDGK